MSHAPEPIAVALRKIVKRFDGQTVLDGLSLEVARGEFLAIVGPSGSGKTTAMRVIGGFEAPDQGTVWIAGRDVTALPAEQRDVNTVFQNYALFPHLSVIDNVSYGPRMRGVPRAERRRQAGELLDLVRLPGVADRRPGELSGGMQQRVALARALANNPAVLLLDEPLGALDRKLREEMQRELRRIQTELGATFLYITHDQEEAFGMADRLAVMRDGRFVQIGDPASLYDQPVDGWVALFLGNANRIRATCATAGALASDFGPIAADHIADDLQPGDPALVVIRPEQTRFVAPVGAEGSTNRIPARISDMVALGPSLRMRATTAGGVAFDAIVPRHACGREATLHVGDAVHVTFEPAAARAYRAGPELHSLLSSS
jgi:ABC-type Fe3+/spermidine/putrescine transport system ATPase subunit